MKIVLSLALLAAAGLFAAAASAADSTDRTSMPQNCSDRNVNCVIQDGPPRRRRGAPEQPPPQAPKQQKGISVIGVDKKQDSSGR